MINVVLVASIYLRCARPSYLSNIIFITGHFVVAGAHSILGCDNSPILLESKENEDGPYRDRFA